MTALRPNALSYLNHLSLKSLVVGISLVSLFNPSTVWARASDRNQPMEIQADSEECNLGDNGQCQFRGNVQITQGTLKINAATADVFLQGGQINRVVIVGQPARLQQTMEDGSPMEATANKMEYEIAKNTILLTGNYTVKSIRGTNTGERMVYNTLTGMVQAGGDGNRIRTIIQPKTAAPATPAAPAPKATPAPETATKKEPN